jgi:hypothetical protein
MQTKVFHAVHVERKPMDKLGDIAAVVASNGGDAVKFLDLCRSFSVAASCSRAKKITGDFGVASFPGVPALAVGRVDMSRRLHKVEVGRRQLSSQTFLVQRVRGWYGLPLLPPTPSSALTPVALAQQRPWHGVAVPPAHSE